MTSRLARLVPLTLLAVGVVRPGWAQMRKTTDCGNQCLSDADFDRYMNQTAVGADAKVPSLVMLFKQGIGKYKPSDVVKLTHELYHGPNEELRGNQPLPFAKKDFDEWQDDVYKGVSAAEGIAKANLMPEGPQKTQELAKAAKKRDEILADFKGDVKRTDPVGELYKAAYDAWAKFNPPPPPSNGGQPPYSPSWGDLWNPASSDVNDGVKKLQDGDPWAAKEAADRALAFDPGSKLGFDLRAQANYDLKDYRGAAQDARSALAIDPNDKTAQGVYGLAHDRGGMGMGDAAGQAQQAAGGAASAAIYGGGGALVPSLAGLSGGGAAPSASAIAAQLSLRDYRAALDAAGRAIEAHPEDPKAYFYSAVARMKLGDQEGALKDAVAGLAVDPKSSALLDAKAEALNRLGHYRDALAAASAALEINPKDPYAYYNRGLALFGMKDREASVESLRRAAAIDPQFQAVAERAAMAPSDADLAFLLPDTGNAAAPSSPARKARRFGVVAVSSVLGGVLIALGILQFFIEPAKSAFTKLTRWGAASTPDQRLTLAPLAQDGSPGLLRGQYQVLRRIGQGGMGVVYEGRDASLERKVAIKRMREELKRDPRECQRFLSEAKLVAALHHPNIVDIYAIVEEGDEVYLVFEHINGRTVHEIIGASGKLGFDHALGILRGVASALDFAHARGIIHRDLKSSNIMVDEEGRPRVMDFGIARAAKDALTRQSMTNTIVGTPPYMAPEQEQGVVRREADVYALGVCFYEMLTGKLPFSGSGAGMLLNKVNNSFAPLSTMAKDLPEGLDSVISMALNPDPVKRFSSAKQLVDALDGLRAGARRSV